MIHFRTIQNYYIDPQWLGQRMLFLSGPRQCGKTSILRHKLCPSSEAYFNWDDRKVRQAYAKDTSFFTENNSGGWIIFDEIHKRPKWKDILKGIYDVHSDQYRFAISGSARLEVFKKSGDSLFGRYFHTHLFPLNLPDFVKNDFTVPRDIEIFFQEAMDNKGHKEFPLLLKFGGFPEPFYKGLEDFWKRWPSVLPVYGWWS
ncbi:MAG: AAA family ATPase [Pseudomonadota bacterium]